MPTTNETLSSNNVHVCALQETMMLDADEAPDMPGYEWIRSCAAQGRRKGGVALLISTQLQHVPVQISTGTPSGVELCAVQLR